MLFTLTAYADPALPDARDLGHLLRKHPDRVQSFPTSLATAHVFYPRARAEVCTVAMLLDVDPIGLVRRAADGRGDFALAQYVNDRPYAASSLLGVAIGKVFSSARTGRSEACPEAAGAELDLEMTLSAVPVRGGAELPERLWGPLGWAVTASPEPLDPAVPGWGMSPYADLVLRGRSRLAQALDQLTVLLPVLDGSKHYWVAADEVDKILRRGGTWLAGHPERGLILRRSLANRHHLVADAAARLAALEDAPAVDDVSDVDASDVDASDVDAPTRRTPLRELRRDAILDALRDAGAHRVVDLGCGTGYLVAALLDDPAYTEIVAADVAPRDLERCERRLRRRPERQLARLTYRHTSVTYRDAALAGYDAIVLSEVVEHLDPDRLPALERSVFGAARPSAVVVTTPNVEYNARYETLPPDRLRHRDHRFEWTRAQFADWAQETAGRHGYDVEFRGVGEEDPELGTPTQLALFRRTTGEVVA